MTEVEALYSTALSNIQTDFLGSMQIILVLAVIVTGTILAWGIIKQIIGGKYPFDR